MTGYRLAAAAAVAAFLWTMGGSPAAAQEGQGTTPLGLAPGTPLGSYPLGGMDHVNLFGGGLSFQLPLVTVGGRGEASSQSFLVIEQHWGLSRVTEFLYEPRFNWFRSVPIRYTAGTMTRWQDREGVLPNYVYLTRMTFTSADHTQHELRDVLTEGRPRFHSFNRGRVFKSFDGSNLTFVADSEVVEQEGSGSGGVSGRLMFPTGVEYRFETGRVVHVRDRNGNAVKFSYDGSPWVTRITDALNRRVDFTNIQDNSTLHTISFRGFGGAAREIQVSYAPLADALISNEEGVQTLAELFPTVSWFAPNQTHNPLVATAVTLPDGRAYTLRYNAYGELARVELPTGGVLTYAYVTAGVSSEWIYRRLSQKSAYVDNVEVMRTTFTVATAGGSQVTTVLHHDPSAPGAPVFASERHHFYGMAEDHLGPTPPATYQAWQSGRAFEAEFLDEAGVVRKRVEHTWQQHSSVPWPAPPTHVPHDPRLVETLTTLDPGAGGASARTTFTHDLVDNHYFNLTDVREYDIDDSLLRRKQTQFEYAAAYFKDDVHLRQLPLVARVWEGESTLREETSYEYDNYTGGLTLRANLSGRLSPDRHDAGFLARGNPTRVRRWLNTTGGYLTTRFDYDVAGNVVRETNPKGYATELLYEDRFGSPDGNAQGNTRPLPELPAPLRTFAFVSETVNPLSHRVQTQRDYFTSKAVDHEDANGVISSVWFEDQLDRPTRTVAANSHDQRSQTTYEYADGQRRVITRRDKDAFTLGAIRTEMHYDHLGREIESRVVEPGGGHIAVRKGYDAKGRLRLVSNPYRPATESVSWTVTEYDALDRMRSVTAPGGGVTTTVHSANTATVTDPAGKQRQSVMDGLGRVVHVIEDPAGLNHLTAYLYDPLDNLVQVTMGGQVRQFVHDSLSRLTSSSNPESGTVAYGYDANGNLEQRTDARGIVTTYGNDELDRPRTITYANEPPGSETPDVTNTYEAGGVPFSKGRLTRVQSSASVSEVLAYDPLGRVTTSRQTTAGQAYGVHYTYDLAGHLTSQTYPSGRVVTTAFDRAERPEAVTSRPFQGTDQPYADHVRYAAHGATAAFRLGNGRWDLTTYNERLQPRFMGLNSIDSPGQARDILQIENRYGGLAQNNGNLRDQIITAPGFNKTQTFVYDPLNRLETAVEGGSWSQAYAYDRFGNRAVTGDLPTPGQSPQSLGHFSTATNRITTAFHPAIQYDVAGNLARDSRSWTYAYDAENHQLSANAGGLVTSYAYDGQGRRVRRAQGAVTTTFVYDAFGRLLADYGGPGSFATTYLTRDHLGSLRVTTDASGAVLSRQDYLPFGEEIPVAWGRTGVHGYGTPSPARQKYSGKERDLETGLDYFGARYFASAQGRFTSIDPGNAGADPAQPQAWNGYAHALNSPLRFDDPNGQAPRDAVNGGRNFVVHMAESLADPRNALLLLWPVAVLGPPLVDTLKVAAQDYWNKGVSGVGEDLLAQGEAGATEIVVEAILSAGATMTPFAKGRAPALRTGTELPRGGNGVVLNDGAGTTPAEMAASSGGPTAGVRGSRLTAMRKALIDRVPAGQPFECWRCGQKSMNPADVHAGHRNKPASEGGNLSPTNICLEGAACNMSAGNRGRPSPGMSCAERGSCGAPYDRD